MFTFSESTTLPAVWHSQRRRATRRYASTPIAPNRISLRRWSLITVLAITTPPSPRLPLLSADCLTTVPYSHYLLTSLADRVIGRNVRGIWNAPSNAIHVTYGYLLTPLKLISTSGDSRKRPPLGIALWLLHPATRIRGWRARSSIWNQARTCNLDTRLFAGL